MAGQDEAKAELVEIIEFLSTLKVPPPRSALPRGVLLIGPPGTGKTLLARAVAGEAEVPFFSISASEFVELFVGVGASRVRDLFTKAKAPLRPSSSSTRSTRSGGSEARVWAEATTSASRRSTSCWSRWMVSTT